MIAELDQVELGQVAVDAVLVGPVSVGGEVRADDVRTADIREAQGDDLERILDTALLSLGVLRIEVVAALDLVVEEREVPPKSLRIQLLLVQCPSELVERGLVVLRAGSVVGDRRVGGLRLAIFPHQEEMLGAAELPWVGLTQAGGFACPLLPSFEPL